MDKAKFSISVIVDSKTFTKFAMFDTLRRQRRFVSPAIFMGILLLFSLLAFSRVGKSEQALLLGIVLASISILLPASYLLSFWLSVKAQVKKLGLAIPHYAYTLQFDDSGVAVSSGREKVYHQWGDLYGAYRLPGYIYLYATSQRAFLLPDGQIKGIEGGADGLWKLFSKRMLQSGIKDLRKAKRALAAH
jgi:hypothetical protein